jgi:hypothetical protein
MNIRRPIILGIVKNYGIPDLSPFIYSLKRTGYTGDVCLFVDGMSPETLEFLYGHGVILQSLPTRYFVQSRRHLIRWVANFVPAKLRPAARIELSRYYLHLIDVRWPCYFDFLKKTRGIYSHVMFTDVKDVLFQRSPFDFEWNSPFCSFYEFPGCFIKTDSHTRGWLEKGFGREETKKLHDKNVICAGVSFAEIDAALEYLDLMCNHLVQINDRGLVDQGIHNYLLHHQLLKASSVYGYSDSPVLHLGMMPPEKLELNGEGLVVNGSGRVVNAIHQYFSHRKALERCLALFTTPPVGLPTK